MAWFRTSIRLTTTQAVVAGTIASSAVIYPPTIAAGDVEVTAGHVASSAAVYPPTVAPGAAEVTAGHVASSAALYPPELAYQVELATIASSAALYPPTVAPGAAQITTGHVASTAVVFPANITMYTAFAELGRSAFYMEAEETATRTMIDPSKTSLEESNILNDPLWLGHVEGWRMEEGANLTRAGIHLRDLVDVNGSVGSAAGKHGAAACYLFGGVDELRASTPDFRFDGDFTLLWWMRPLDTWGPPNQPLLRYQDDATGIDWEVFSNNGKLYFRIHDSISGSEEQFFENDWTVSQWHLCTLLYDATARRMRAVLDADLGNDRQTAALTNGLRQGGTRLRLGDNAGAAADLLWQGDEMHLFNKLKDDAWITDMHDGGAGRAYPT